MTTENDDLVKQAEAICGKLTDTNETFDPVARLSAANFIVEIVSHRTPMA